MGGWVNEWGMMDGWINKSVCQWMGQWNKGWKGVRVRGRDRQTTKGLRPSDREPHPHSLLADPAPMRRL